MNNNNTSNFDTMQWLKVNFLGWLLGAFLIIGLSSFLDSLGIENMQFYLGLGMGAGVGLVQWKQLKKWLDMPIKWFWVSTLGLGLTFFFIDFIPKESLPFKIPVSIAIGSIICGYFQGRLFTKIHH